MPEFGKDLRKEFLLDPEYVFVNHGSYGAVARRVNDAKLRRVKWGRVKLANKIWSSKNIRRKQVEFEAVPDMWFRKNYWSYYKENIEAAADFLGADPENIVFTNNTTTGINTVLRCLTLKPGDKILTNSWTYGAMKNAVAWVTENTGAEFVMVDLRTPLKKETLLEQFKVLIAEHGSAIKLAIIDYISSVPPVLMPWAELTSMCKESNIPVLIDGAHSPGQVHLNLESMGVDYFVGNLHKWVYTHRGCAVLYVSPEHKSEIHPLVTSVFLKDKDMRRRFYYQGTDDCTTFTVVKEAIGFVQDMGGLDAIMEYNRDLANKAAAMLVQRWGTGLLEIPPDMEAPNMKMVRLPVLKRFPPVKEVTGDVNTLYGDINPFIFEMMDRFKIITVGLFSQSEPFVRISANIYNCMEDYERLAEAVMTLKAEDEANAQIHVKTNDWIDE